jgi:SAM-dependent methyltransferase
MGSVHAAACDLVARASDSAGLSGRRRALAAEARGRVLDVSEGSGIELGHDRLPEASFDTVVCTLVLCRVPDPGRVLAEIRRSLGPAGRLLFLEHVRSGRVASRVQRAVGPAWRRVAGCSLGRDTVAAIWEAGFVVTDCRRFRRRTTDLLVGPLVEGTARVRKRPLR